MAKESHEEKSQTLRDWATECLMFDQYDDFFAYCRGLGDDDPKREDDVASGSKFEELRGGFESKQTKN